MKAKAKNGSVSWKMKLDSELHRQIQAMSQQETRTINNMIQVLLKEAINGRKAV